jgi:hypothetical protein
MGRDAVNREGEVGNPIFGGPILWLPGMDSNHKLDMIFNARNLLIPKVAEVAESFKSRYLVQNRYKNIFSNRAQVDAERFESPMDFVFAPLGERRLADVTVDEL